ncbi:alpha/beta hydrolase [Jannaschia aquimarina]|uniref:LipR protein n=1 Tax=Jannaschia aquimarina TaxID=935700 RepID=A0A0D1EGG6_9RHOB|nr:alpha/beta hydrolase [Jannaschia aquimarina]KIT16016.1 putative acetyl-hydrolase LipR precursor [Jannaschia aquimarina]SNT00138.1 Acetyl esterase/lipase [Jannaschia aquimarina]
MSTQARFDRMRALTARWIDRPLLALPLPIAVHRAMFEMQARLATKTPRLPARWERIAGVPCRIVTPPDAVRRVLYLHGGGFILGSPRTHAGLTDRIASAARAEVIVPDYRLAPEHPFPAAVEDCEAVARALEPGFHLGGDSAGGGIALAVLQDLLRRGTPPATVFLISPVARVDATREAPPDHDEMLLPEAFLRRCIAAYACDVDCSDPRLSPIHGRYDGCPPVHIEVSAREVLEGDGQAVAALLRGYGAPVEVARVEGVPHVYHLSAGYSAAADAAIERIVASLGPA